MNRFSRMKLTLHRVRPVDHRGCRLLSGSSRLTWISLCLVFLFGCDAIPINLPQSEGGVSYDMSASSDAAAMPDGHSWGDEGISIPGDGATSNDATGGGDAAAPDGLGDASPTDGLLNDGLTGDGFLGDGSAGDGLASDGSAGDGGVWDMALGEGWLQDGSTDAEADQSGDAEINDATTD